MPPETAGPAEESARARAPRDRSARSARGLAPERKRDSAPAMRRRPSRRCLRSARSTVNRKRGRQGSHDRAELIPDCIMPTAARRPVIEARYDQMFPVLQPAEIERLRRFGDPRTYAAGERVVTAGEPSPGMIVVLGGELAVTQHNVLGHDQLIVAHGP